MSHPYTRARALPNPAEPMRARARGLRVNSGGSSDASTGVIARAPARHGVRGAEPDRAARQRAPELFVDACERWGPERLRSELQRRLAKLSYLDARIERLDRAIDRAWAAQERAEVALLRAAVGGWYRAAVGRALNAGAVPAEVEALRVQWRIALRHPPRSSAPRCGARTRTGGACGAPPVWDRSAGRPVNGRCRRHGGCTPPTHIDVAPSAGPEPFEAHRRNLQRGREVSSANAPSCNGCPAGSQNPTTAPPEVSTLDAPAVTLGGELNRGVCLVRGSAPHLSPDVRICPPPTRAGWPDVAGYGRSPADESQRKPTELAKVGDPFARAREALPLAQCRTCDLDAHNTPRARASA